MQLPLSQAFYVVFVLTTLDARLNPIVATSISFLLFVRHVIALYVHIFFGTEDNSIAAPCVVSCSKRRS